jgi:molybdate transport system substrate-binding protein
MLRRTAFALAALLGALSATPAPSTERGPLVLAAASLQEALTAAGGAWQQMGHPRPVLSFAGTPSLARQVQAGAAADLFASADEEWMDALQRARLIVPATRANLARNRLVVVAPAGSAIRLTTPMLARTLAAGPVAMADPDAVPAGKYGRAALVRLGAWRAVQPHVVRAESVRAAMALVERGAAPFGIVYLTDARASARVKVVGVFPASSHPAILYPIARLRTSTSRDAEGFRRFLLSPRGQAILARFGFAPS